MYIVIELQSNGESVSNIVTAHETYNEAQSKYHQILSAAAISSVPIHSAVLLSENGTPLMNKYFEHSEE